MTERCHINSEQGGEDIREEDQVKVKVPVRREVDLSFTPRL